VEEDFIVMGLANMVEVWRQYTLTQIVSTDESGDVWVFIGISVRWETFMTF
jgi:hypothetical protein